MNIQETCGKSIITLTLKGSLDETTSSAVEAKLKDVFSKDAKNIVLDMEGVGYISSIGIRILIMAHKRAVELDKKLIIEKMSEKVRITLKLVGILQMFVTRA